MMNVILSLEAKLTPCPKCGGKAIVDAYVERYVGAVDIDVECTKCGLRMGYQYDPCDSELPVRITWTYDSKSFLSVADAWKSYREACHECN